jgi:hypothetical protein
MSAPLYAGLRSCTVAQFRDVHRYPGYLQDRRGIQHHQNDVRHEARFDDSVGIYPRFIDGYGVLIIPTTGRYMHIPYRAMLPKQVKSLIVAGRAIGGDRIAHAATRNMACCAVAGQGAGVAAAVSIKDRCGFDEVSMTSVQAILKDQGVRIA